MEIESRRPITIRNALADDYDELVSLWNAAGSGFSPRGRETREAYARHVAQFPGLSLVAMDAGRIVGVVIGSHDGRKGWINRLAVLPGYRRRGIAGLLVTSCDTAIRAQGIELVAALVEVGNEPSAGLFRKLGYSDAVRVHYFRKLSHPDA